MTELETIDNAIFGWELALSIDNMGVQHKLDVAEFIADLREIRKAVEDGQ